MNLMKKLLLITLFCATTALADYIRTPSGVWFVHVNFDGSALVIDPYGRVRTGLILPGAGIIWDDDCSVRHHRSRFDYDWSD
jgi:hypothetical protein